MTTYLGGGPILDIVDGLLKGGLLELSDPDKSTIRHVTLTETGLNHYRVLCKRQRHQDTTDPASTKTPSASGLDRMSDVNSQ
ncbi:MAG: hypothetical protein ACRDRE_14980 [Pseudonocardiaceae bacterium]